MYTESKPDGTMLINFEGDEWDAIQRYAIWQGVEPTFFVAIALQTAIRNMTMLFPQKLTMPGYLDREIKNHPCERCPRCHRQQLESLKKIG